MSCLLQEEQAGAGGGAKAGGNRGLGRTDRSVGAIAHALSIQELAAKDVDGLLRGCGGGDAWGFGRGGFRFDRLDHRLPGTERWASALSSAALTGRGAGSSPAQVLRLGVHARLRLYRNGLGVAAPAPHPEHAQNGWGERSSAAMERTSETPLSVAIVKCA